ncbi:DUF6843 domain-containing protein [Anoxybacteroides tepidamans]|uniref:DUF6843 domain-containing protein n=1 Tax=Anoxybacteroides tepidamans TaxID=265948 RepID=UPI000484B264|nr:hypothetical protein [Anoxybacillus tepidamans]
MGRKIKSALFSTLALSGSIFLLDFIKGFEENPFINFIVVFIYAAIGNFLYGIPVSILSDIITKKLVRYRFIAAAWIHILFGLLTIFMIRELWMYSVICSLLFFLSEEWQRRRKRNVKPSFNTIVLKGTAVILLFCIIIFVGPQLMIMTEEKTHYYYLIPKGYVGKFIVVYNIKHAQKPEKIGDYDVVKINEKGYALISTPQKYGDIEDKYFYIDEKGNKEEIDQKCIDVGATESISGEGYEYTGDEFYIKPECGNESQNVNDPVYPEELELEEILIEEGLIDRY